MKIAHISRQYYPGIGGLESFTRSLCREQVRAGHQVRMITLERIFDGDGRTLPRSEMIDDVEIIRVPYRGGRRYPLAPSVIRHVKDCDLVHVHAVDFFADFLSLTRMIHRKPLVLSTHGGFFHTSYARRWKEYYFQTISRFSLSRFRAVIACSKADYDMFARICPRALTLVENGVDTTKFAGLARQQPSDRAIIYFGRIAPNKQIDLLIRWFAGIYRLDASWRLIIAGKSMGVSLSDLRDMAQALGLSEVVEFYDSPSDDELKQLIARSSIFASPSAYEGFGISLIEAVSAGLYPAVSDIPAHRRSCDRLNTGSLIDFADARSATRLLQDFRAARGNRASSITNAGLQKYSWPQVTANILAIYDHVLGHKFRHIGPLKVSVLSSSQATDVVHDLIQSQNPQVIAFCNAHLTNMARRIDGLAAALDDALILNDGVGADIASWLRYGATFPENLNGTDFIPLLLSEHKQGLRIFLVGSLPGIAERAARQLERRYPHVKIVGTQHGYFDPQEELGLCRSIQSSGADLVIAAMGNPRQEIWAAQWAPHFSRPVLCAGAFLDFMVGHVRRAPSWVRRLRLEWVYRLTREPTRLADRYLRGNFSFLAHAIKDARQGYYGGSMPTQSSQSQVVRGADAA